MTTSKYETIIPLYDLQQRSNEEQIKYLTEYRIHFTNKEITDYWNKSENFIYTLMNKIGMDKKNMKRQYKKRAPKADAIKKVLEPKAKEEATQVYMQAPESSIELDGFGFTVNGTYTAEKIIKRLEKLSLILDDEDAEFEINLTIKEKVEIA